MATLSTQTRERVREIAGRHGFSAAAAEVMLAAIARGRGAMAQFDHPEFGGSGQWMRGGMTMVADMFNNALKARVDALCTELAALVDGEPGLTAFDPRAWWPAELHVPDSTGAQNDVRYAWFAAPRRLAIEREGKVTVYDTLDHRIVGFSQQQSDTTTLSFSSQHGRVDIERLPVVKGGATGEDPARAVESVPSAPPSTGAAPSHAEPAHDAITAMERLAELRARGILSDSEFAVKKAELLGRI